MCGMQIPVCGCWRAQMFPSVYTRLWHACCQKSYKEGVKRYMPWGSGVNGTWFTFVEAQTKYLFHTVLCQHKKRDFASFTVRRKKVSCRVVMNFLHSSECVHPHVNVHTVPHVAQKIKRYNRGKKWGNKPESDEDRNKEIFHVTSCSLGPDPDVTRVVFVS